MKKQKMYGVILLAVSGVTGLLGSLTPAVLLVPMGLGLILSRENLMY